MYLPGSLLSSAPPDFCRFCEITARKVSRQDALDLTPNRQGMISSGKFRASLCETRNKEHQLGFRTEIPSKYSPSFAALRLGVRFKALGVRSEINSTPSRTLALSVVSFDRSRAVMLDGIIYFSDRIPMYLLVRNGVVPLLKRATN